MREVRLHALIALILSALPWAGVIAGKVLEFHIVAPPYPPLCSYEHEWIDTAGGAAASVVAFLCAFFVYADSFYNNEKGHLVAANALAAALVLFGSSSLGFTFNRLNAAALAASATASCALLAVAASLPFITSNMRYVRFTGYACAAMLTAASAPIAFARELGHIPHDAFGYINPVIRALAILIITQKANQVVYENTILYIVTSIVGFAIMIEFVLARTGGIYAVGVVFVAFAVLASQRLMSMTRTPAKASLMSLTSGLFGAASLGIVYAGGSNECVERGIVGASRALAVAALYLISSDWTNDQLVGEIEFHVSPKDLMSPRKPCPSLISSYVILVTGVACCTLSPGKLPFGILICVLGISSIVHHTRPYGSNAFDWIDTIDRVLVATCTVYAIVILLGDVRNDWTWVLSVTAAAAAIIIYINGALLNMLLRRSRRAAWCQVAVHLCACVSFLFAIARDFT